MFVCLFVVCLFVYLCSEFVSLHCIVADLEDDLGMIVDVIEGKVGQCVLVVGVKLLIQSRKDRRPMRGLEREAGT